MPFQQRAMSAGPRTAESATGSWRSIANASVRLDAARSCCRFASTVVDRTDADGILAVEPNHVLAGRPDRSCSDATRMVRETHVHFRRR